MNKIIIVIFLFIALTLINLSNQKLIMTMLVLSIVVLIFFILRNRDILKRMHNKTPEELNIINVDKGGVFTLTGVGNDSEEMTLKVIGKHLYREGDFYWYELQCDKGSDENVWVEVEEDDDTIVYILLKKMNLNDIKTNPSTLTQIDDDEAGSVYYEGKEYKYKDSSKAIYYKNCDDKKQQNFYYWDFEYGKNVISVEKWSEKDYEVSLSQRMLPSQIKVLSNKSEELK